MTTKELERIEEIKIDPATGLPELAEGLIWEIGESKYNEDVIRVLRYGTETEIQHLRTWKTLWLKPEATHVAVTGYHVWLAEYFDKHGNRDNYDDEVLPEFVICTREKYGNQPCVTIPFTREGVEYMARRVARRLKYCIEADAKRKADAAFREQTYGQYPPKSL